MKAISPLLFRFVLSLAILGNVAGIVLAKPPVIAESTLRGHLEFLASAELQGRKALQPGSRIAAKYIASEFLRYGLQPCTDASYYQPVPVENFEFQPNRSFMVVTTSRGTAQTDTLWGGKTFYLFPRSKIGAVSGGIAICGYGVQAPEAGYDDFKGIEVSGKFILALMGEPASQDTSNFFGKGKPTRYGMIPVKAKLAEKLGAIGLILTTAPSTRESVWNPAVERKKEEIEDDIIQSVGDSEFPVMYLDPNQAAVLANEDLMHQTPAMAGSGEFKTSPIVIPNIELSLYPAFSDVVLDTVANVIGKLEGGKSSANNRTMILGAHYDHLGTKDGDIFYGADDNASGVSALLTLAEALSPQSSKLQTTVLFIAFGAEEEGLIGSKYYVEHPLLPLEQTIAMVNLDCIGREGALSYRAINQAPQTEKEISSLIAFYSAGYPGLKDLVSKVTNPGDLALHFEPMYGRFAVGDHYPFLAHDIPALFFFSGYHSDYHTPNDRIEKINFPKLTLITILVYDVALEMAKKSIRFEQVHAESSKSASPMY
jgi:hypothetical protein